MDKFLCCFDLETGCSYIGKLLIPVSVIVTLVSIFQTYEFWQISCDHLDRKVVIGKEYEVVGKGKSERFVDKTAYDICSDSRMRKKYYTLKLC